MAVNRNAQIGDGATLRLGPTSLTSVVTNEAVSNYTNIGQCLTFNPQMECAEHDVTHMGSGTARQFIPGHVAATVQASVNLIPTELDDDGLNAEEVFAAYQARAHRNWIFSVKCSGTNTSDTNTQMLVAFRGFITNLSWSADRDAVNTADLTIRVSDSTMVRQDPFDD